MATIFLSYSSKDNSLPPGWVEGFSSKLKEWIRYIGLEGSEVWFDKDKIITGDQLTNKLQTELENSDIIMPILSGYYFDEEYKKWVEMELNYFREVKGDASIKKIFFIEKIQVDINKINPPELRDLKRFQFYQQIGDRKLPYHFKPDDELFDEKICELAYDIKAYFTTNPVEQNTKKKVAIITTPQLYDNANELLRELKKKFDVNIGLSASKDLSTVKEKLESYDYIIFTLGIYPGKTVRDSITREELYYNELKAIDWENKDITTYTKIPAEEEFWEQIDLLDYQIKTIETSWDTRIKPKIERTASDLLNPDLTPKIGPLLEVLKPINPYFANFVECNQASLVEEFVKSGTVDSLKFLEILKKFIDAFKTEWNEKLADINRQKSFIDKVRNDTGTDGLFDPIDKSFFDFKMHVLNKIN